MKILMIGSGGREHALVRKLNESSKVSKIYCAPGNGGIGREALNVDIGVMETERLVSFAKEKEIDLVFVAPDDPLAAGLVDAFEKNGIRAFGPRANAAIIEASKVFSKNLMKKYNIPTAKYEVFDDSEKAIKWITDNNVVPVVIKADGLALGKGVIICNTLEEAMKAVKTIMEDKKFGNSGNNIVVEEFLTGPEVSVLSFTDGNTVVPMVSSKDH
ncbi:MAG: phosphoribosylamine--glycine ligase, partial [Acutalibacteraceae bacterium]